MLFFLRCFFRLEWGDGGGSSLGLELSTSAGPLAGEGEVEKCGERGGASTGPARGAGGSTLNCSRGRGKGGHSRPVRTPGGVCPQAPRRPRPWRKGGWRGACRNRRQGRVKVQREPASAAWRAEGGRGLETQQLRTRFILNHTPRSSQLIAELETIRELPNYCQLERANQAPVSHTPPDAHH